jgi:transcriptional regulator with XRE-family HTH domain
LIESGWNRHCRRLDLPTDEHVADALGLSRVTVWRVRTGQTAPGMRFIARVLNLMRGAQFEELFEVYMEDGED